MTMRSDITKKLTHFILLPLAVFIVLWEQLVYRPIKWVSSYLEKNKIIHRLADKVRNANPYVALLILACAGLPLIPFKIAGLWLVGNGYTLLGIGTFGLAKIVGGAVSVQIFNLTEPAIRKLSWINQSLNWVFGKKNKIKKILTDMPVMIAVKEHTHKIKQVVKNWLKENAWYQKVKNVFHKKPKPVLIGEPAQVNTFETPQSTLIERIKHRHQKYIKEYRVD